MSKYIIIPVVTITCAFVHKFHQCPEVFEKVMDGMDGCGTPNG